MTFDSSASIFYFAAVAFLFTVLLEFWRRTHLIGRAHLETPLSDRMEKAIHYFRENKRRKRITNDIYQKLTKVSHSTASHDLQKLEELGFLEQRGRTRGIYYIFTPKATTHTKTHKISSKKSYHKK